MYEQEMEQKDSGDFPRIVVRIDALEKMMEKARETLIELEARISPVLRQEPPAVLAEMTKASIADTSAVISQRLFTLELRLAEHIDAINALYNRSEV